MSESHTPTPADKYSLNSVHLAQIRQQHYEPTAPPPEESRNTAEHTMRFERLQTELQTFLHRHLQETLALSNGLLRNRMHDAANYAGQEIITRPRLADIESHEIAREVSKISNPEEEESKDRPFHSATAPNDDPPLLEHIQALQTFLMNHSVNLRGLQAVNNALLARENPSKSIDEKSVYLERSQLDNLNQQFNMLVLTSTFTAALIVAFLSLVVAVISTRNTTFNVGMLFAFISVGVHFGNIVVAGRGISLTGHHDEDAEQKTAEYFKLYLGVCEQLQFAATLIFILATLIMSFIMFSSVAYPVILLVLSLLGITVVFSSVYWEVSMTYHNIKLLLKNLQHFRAPFQNLGNWGKRKGMFSRRF